MSLENTYCNSFVNMIHLDMRSNTTNKHSLNYTRLLISNNTGKLTFKMHNFYAILNNNTPIPHLMAFLYPVRYIVCFGYRGFLIRRQLHTSTLLSRWYLMINDVDVLMILFTNNQCLFSNLLVN